MDGVPEKEWFYADIMEASRRGIVLGVSLKDFLPRGNIKRGDFALMIARALKADLSSYSKNSIFSDVSDNDYYAAAINYAADNGIVGGYADGTFKPNDLIKRQEVAAVVSRVLELEERNNPKVMFTDHSIIPSWALGNIYACRYENVLLGDNNGNYNPVNLMTRAEAATIIVRMLKQ